MWLSEALLNSIGFDSALTLVSSMEMKAEREAVLAILLVLPDPRSVVGSDDYSKLEWTQVSVLVEAERVVMVQESGKAEREVSELVCSAT